MFKKFQTGYQMLSPIKKAAQKIKQTFSKKTNQSKISPDIKQPRQLKKTMEKMRSEYQRFGFKDAKTAQDRANIVRTKKSIERMNKVDELKKKRKEGIKASKEMKKMVDTKQAEKIGSTVYPHHVKERKAKGGRIGFNKGSKDPVGKKKNKFPDHSGDGQITQKDILMAKGVIPKPKSKKKVI